MVYSDAHLTDDVIAMRGGLKAKTVGQGNKIKLFVVMRWMRLCASEVFKCGGERICERTPQVSVL